MTLAQFQDVQRAVWDLLAATFPNGAVQPFRNTDPKRYDKAAIANGVYQVAWPNADFEREARAAGEPVVVDLDPRVLGWTMADGWDLPAQDKPDPMWRDGGYKAGDNAWRDAFALEAALRADPRLGFGPAPVPGGMSVSAVLTRISVDGVNKAPHEVFSARLNVRVVSH